MLTLKINEIIFHGFNFIFGHLLHEFLSHNFSPGKYVTLCIPIHYVSFHHSLLELKYYFIYKTKCIFNRGFHNRKNPTKLFSLNTPKTPHLLKSYADLTISNYKSYLPLYIHLTFQDSVEVVMSTLFFRRSNSCYV